MKFVSFVMIVMSAAALALPSGPPQKLPKGYVCDVTVIAKDLPDGYGTASIARPYQAEGSHGGDPVEIKFGDHTLSILADSSWRAISWSHGNTTIAEIVTAAVSPYTQHHVLIAYNPANIEEQASLSCMPD